MIDYLSEDVTFLARGTWSSLKFGFSFLLLGSCQWRGEKFVINDIARSMREIHACIEVLLTVMFIPLNNWEQFETSLLLGEVGCREFFRNRCSSNIDAVGRSAGFLWKHNLRKSLPSGDIDSGIGGLSLMTLNIAAAYDKVKLIQRAF